ncbi:lipoyl(octanoyl) transferase LipB [Geothermobacter hydrogeniphilus]|uniref:Octanoyltransferase n=1 Tax=Geothermobacter hydrogeniphilus TaxID=1969733 RepID=A0A1X0XW86_9BACT|nr:lipoyl(octanoyl) transferase LipB [Geothermobacter hydrogeniphilus]ORJ57129.1 octanoyltransferase [Geothermobacter hydrogeniphilus]
MNQQLIIRHLGLQPYLPVWQRMQSFTNEREAPTCDEIWLLEHPPVFTLGRAGKTEHLLAPGTIPVVSVDRGGLVTYHGPGQLVAYLMIDLKRRRLTVRTLVTAIEKALIALLADYGVAADTRPGAPGVYVGTAKIASLGLRIQHGCSFHGLALNLDMDLEPFARINPCGYQGLQMTQLKELVGPVKQSEVAARLAEQLSRKLGYNTISSRRNWD